MRLVLHVSLPDGSRLIRVLHAGPSLSRAANLATFPSIVLQTRVFKSWSRVSYVEFPSSDRLVTRDVTQHPTGHS